MPFTPVEAVEAREASPAAAIITAGCEPPSAPGWHADRRTARRRRRERQARRRKAAGNYEDRASDETTPMTTFLEAAVDGRRDGARSRSTPSTNRRTRTCVGPNAGRHTAAPTGREHMPRASPDYSLALLPPPPRLLLLALPGCSDVMDR